ncbi:hypothetical protein [Flagellimonas sp. CMM7]|uniref:hypothetical protein n=1 Tax=Flagellimonas sp. CMM7 TaxID=2654676 RepID=UPI0013D351A5|nr:hypothetical protein [Flagellimonas sp. CMM7]UII80121.1 hypothetical protein LV704_01040 [Flagellimonas sp. CMM7]
MASLRHFKVKASSLTESIIAMVIVAICLSIAMVVYVTILKHDRGLPHYKAEQKVKELLWVVQEERLWEDEDYTFDSFTITKKVEQIKGLENTNKVVYTVNLPNGNKNYTYVVSK